MIIVRIHVLPHFKINFYNWSYSKLSLHLNWLVTIFYEKNICSKKLKGGGNQNKVHEAKTVENVKYEPILRT